MLHRVYKMKDVRRCVVDGRTIDPILPNGMRGSRESGEHLSSPDSRVFSRPGLLGGTVPGGDGGLLTASGPRGGLEAAPPKR